MAAPPKTLARIMEILHHPNLSHSLAALLTASDLKRAHACAITSGLSGDLFTAARLLAAAAIPSSGNLHYAQSLFSNSHRPTLFMYNTMIRAFSQSADPIESLRFYAQMLQSRISPDRFTFPFLIRSCSVLPSTGPGRGVHCHAAKLGLDSDVFVVNHAITMYSDWGDMDSARRLFDEHRRVLDVVSWTALITGYSDCWEIGEARRIFDQMPIRNSVSWNAMIAGYAQNGFSREAWELFDVMPEKNIASWSSLVCGFTRSRFCKDALSAFNKMVRVGATPNEPTLISVVSCCAQLRDLEQGKRIHSYIEEHDVNKSVVLATALIDMYGKCGSIGNALKVFDEIPEKNVYSWNSMIVGLAMNGSGKQALTLLWKMRLTGIDPNAVTFVGLLSACSHSGLVDEGRRLFDTMTRSHGIEPIPEHSGCMVDLFGRAGLLKEAIDFIDRTPIKSHSGLWGALAGACRIHGDIELGEEVAKRLIELEPDNSGRYLLLANMYGAARRWEDAAKVKRLLRKREVAIATWNSTVEISSN